jgi:hypothetical protein
MFASHVCGILHPSERRCSYPERPNRRRTMSDLSTTFPQGDLEPDACYEDPAKDAAAHQHPRNAAEQAELEEDLRILGAGSPVLSPPYDGPTMGPADGIPYPRGEGGEGEEMPHDPFADEENERLRREAGEGTGTPEIEMVGD